MKVDWLIRSLCAYFLSCFVSEPSWIGAMVSWVLVVLLTSITPMVEYFHTFEISTNMVVMTSISVGQKQHGRNKQEPTRGGKWRSGKRLAQTRGSLPLPCVFAQFPTSSV